jgi:V8-like Glu-specific endopeptidase
VTGEECGKNDISDGHFVAYENRTGSWPWMASYGLVNQKDQWEHRCGATLISDHHFLTASHCVKADENKG